MERKSLAPWNIVPLHGVSHHSKGNSSSHILKAAGRACSIQPICTTKFSYIDSLNLQQWTSKLPKSEGTEIVENWSQCAEREKTWRLEPAEQHPDHHHNPLVRDRSCHACNLCNTISAYAAVKNLSRCFRVRRKETHFTNWCKDMPREKNGSCNLLM